MVINENISFSQEGERWRIVGDQLNGDGIGVTATRGRDAGGGNARRTGGDGAWCDGTGEQTQVSQTFFFIRALGLQGSSRRILGGWRVYNWLRLTDSQLGTWRRQWEIALGSSHTTMTSRVMRNLPPGEIPHYHYYTYLKPLLSLRLAGAGVARNYVRSSFLQWALSMTRA